MFIAYADLTTGEIKAYKECPDAPDDSETPSGCKKVEFSNTDGMFDKSGSIAVKIDPDTNQVIMKNTPVAL